MFHSFEESTRAPEHSPVECMNTSHSKSGMSFCPSSFLAVTGKGPSLLSEAVKSFLSYTMESKSKIKVLAKALEKNIMRS